MGELARDTRSTLVVGDRVVWKPKVEPRYVEKDRMRKLLGPEPLIVVTADDTDPSGPCSMTYQLLTLKRNDGSMVCDPTTHVPKQFQSCDFERV